MSKKFTTEQFVEKARMVHGGRYDYSKTVYADSRHNVQIVCPKHGAFEQRPSAHLSGNGCPMCAREWTDEHRASHAESARSSRGMTTEEWVERAKAVHGGKYDYSLTKYVNQRTDVTIICPKHGIFTQKADSHLRGCGCRLCGLEAGSAKADHTWSKEQHEKTEKTCMERYGAKRFLDSAEGKEKSAAIRSDPEFRKKMREIISSEDVQRKTKQTCVERYGVEAATKLPETQRKIYETKKRNHTVSSSKSEEKAYAVLVRHFGADDVVHQYRHDERYPFSCDFYVRSLDLFIEFNLHWTHGGSWFQGSPEQIVKLEDWKRRAAAGSTYYESAVYAWTVRDVRKLEAAKRNNLNYLVFWKNDLSDFTNWIEHDPLMLKNI